MRNKLKSFLIFMFIFSSFFACELISNNDSDSSNSDLSNSDSPSSDQSLCDLMKIEEIFPAEDGSNSNSLGEFAEDFTYSCPDGSLHKLSDFREKKVVIIKFWAKYCPYCMKSLPAFNDLHKKYSKDGLLIIGMNVRDSGNDIIRIMKGEDYTFRNVYKASPYMLTGYNSIPLNAMIDKDGKYQFVELGAMPTNEQIESLLKEV